jgi:transcription initiation factor TFIID subunit TAF12
MMSPVEKAQQQQGFQISTAAQRKRPARNQTVWDATQEPPMICWDGDHQTQAENLTSATVTIPEELAPGCSMRTLRKHRQLV